MFQPGLVFPLTYAGLALIPLTIAAFLFAFETVLVLLLAWPLIGERPTRGRIAAAGAGTIGVLLISRGGIGGDTAALAGILLVMGGVLAAAMHTITTRAIAVDADPLPMAAASLLVGLTIVVGALLIWPADWSGILNVSTMSAVVISGVLLHGAAPGRRRSCCLPSHR